MDIIKFSPEELHSMALWDAFCEAMPITAQERRECAERDAYCTATNFTVPVTPAITDEQRQKKREYAAKWRKKNKAKVRGYYTAHADEVRERMREYRKFNSTTTA